VLKFDLEDFHKHVRPKTLAQTKGGEGENAALRAAENFGKYISDVCDASMPLISPGPRSKRPMYW